MDSKNKGAIMQRHSRVLILSLIGVAVIVVIAGILLYQRQMYWRELTARAELRSICVALGNCPPDLFDTYQSVVIQCSADNPDSIRRVEQCLRDEGVPLPS